jgi:hypothetical protein
MRHSRRERMLAKWLTCVGLELWGATIVPLSPHNERLNKRMKELREGDVVMENTTAYFRTYGSYGKPEDVWHGIGYFIRVAQEHFAPREGDEPWDEVAEGRPEPTTRVFYIRDFSGEERRWENAEFITIYPVEGWLEHERNNR